MIETIYIKIKEINNVKLLTSLSLPNKLINHYVANLFGSMKVIYKKNTKPLMGRNSG